MRVHNARDVLPKDKRLQYLSGILREMECRMQQTREIYLYTLLRVMDMLCIITIMTGKIQELNQIYLLPGHRHVLQSLGKQLTVFGGVRGLNHGLTMKCHSPQKVEIEKMYKTQEAKA